MVPPDDQELLKGPTGCRSVPQWELLPLPARPLGAECGGLPWVSRCCCPGWGPPEVLPPVPCVSEVLSVRPERPARDAGTRWAAATLPAVLLQEEAVSVTQQRENARGDRSRVFFLDPWQAGLHPPGRLRKGQDSGGARELPALLVTFTVSLGPSVLGQLLAPRAVSLLSASVSLVSTEVWTGGFRFWTFTTHRTFF